MIPQESVLGIFHVEGMDTVRTKHTPDSIRVATMFEAAKGILVLFAGSGLLLLIHSDIHSVAEQFVRQLHLNPAKHYPRIFLDAVNHLTDLQLWALALSALCYWVVRFAEAYGLWFHRQWAEWFGFLTGGIYIPLELYEMLHGVTWIKLTILIVNLVVVILLGNALYQSRQKGGNPSFPKHKAR
jgi:uncharacterized membrane protein (DUF2068 family)